MSKTVRLMSYDRVFFNVDQSVAEQSQTIIDYFRDNDNADDTGIMPLPNVSGKVFSQVLDYCKKHSTDHDKLNAVKLKKWDARFIDVDVDQLYDLIMAANYLEVKGLLELCCQKVADMIKGKTPEEIRKKFNIKNDFTPQEEEEIYKEHSWAFH